MTGDSRHDPRQLPREALEQASLHALGGLEDAEARAYERHVDDCPACEAELEAMEAIARRLAEVVAPVSPPDALLGRVLQRVRGQVAGEPGEAGDAGETGETGDAGETGAAQPWKSWAAPEREAVGARFVRAGETGWQRTSVAGVEARQLHVDPAGQRVTMLVRMAPGSAYPGHRHGGDEECYVIEGDLRVGDVTMRAGDYQFAVAGTEHPVQSTEGGCLLFLSSSLDDELIA